MDTTDSPQEPTLSAVVIPLLKGVVYQENDTLQWSRLVALDAKVRDYVRVLNLELVLDEAEGYAFLRSRDTDENASGKPAPPAPRLFPRRQLSFPSACCSRCCARNWRSPMPRVVMSGSSSPAMRSLK